MDTKPPSGRAAFNGDPGPENIADALSRGTESSADSDMRRYAAQDMDRETTRYLSAATQLSIEYARQVAYKIVGEPYRALAPTYGVNVVTVARWALDSLRRRILRDLQLTALLCGWLLLLWLMPVFSLVNAITMVAMFIAAWAVVTQERWARLYQNVVGKMLRYRFDPEPGSAPEPRDPKIARRLEKMPQGRCGNLVVFSGQSAFIGSGERLGSEHIVIDVSHGKRDENGKASDPLPFTSAQVHSALMSAFEGMGLADMRVEERLFINGRHFAENEALLRTREGYPFISTGHNKRPELPPTSVDAELIRRTSLHPTPDARAYVCVEMPGWQGQLVVTLFARAVHKGGLLYVEWRFYVLPPLRREFLAIDLLYGKPRSQQYREASVWGLRHMTPALLGSLFRVIAGVWRLLAVRRYVVKQASAIRNGHVFDYGARTSIREDARGESRQHYFLARDELMFALFAQQTLLREISEFLEKHNIDLAEFKAQIEVIVKATYENYNVHIGDVRDSDIAIGKKAKAGSGSRGGGSAGAHSQKEK